MVYALMIIRSKTLMRPMATFFGVRFHGLFGLRRQENGLRKREQGRQGKLMRGDVETRQNGLCSPKRDGLPSRSRYLPM